MCEKERRERVAREDKLRKEKDELELHLKELWRKWKAAEQATGVESWAEEVEKDEQLTKKKPPEKAESGESSKKRKSQITRIKERVDILDKEVSDLQEDRKRVDVLDKEVSKLQEDRKREIARPREGRS